MRKFFFVPLVLVVGFFLTGYAFADDKADCVSLSEAAAKMMKEDLPGALCEINKKDGKFVKGKIFVFAWRGGILVAHPFRPQSIGKDITNHKDKEGKEFVKEYLKVVKEKGSGWVSYKWPKPGEKELSDKVTYVLKVDENFYVTAGYFK